MAGLVRKTFVTCVDTGETYDLDLPEHDGSRPQIWNLLVIARPVTYAGGLDGPGIEADLYVTRQTMVDLGLVRPSSQLNDQPQPEENKEKTIEELLLELLRKLREKEAME